MTTSDSEALSPLPYDDFPVYSTIVRERRGDVLYITVPASEPDARALANARRYTALPPAVWTVAGTAVAMIPFVAMVRQISGRVPATAEAAFVVLVASVFLLLWRSGYQHRRDELEKTWARATVVAIRDGAVLIEESAASISLSSAAVRSVTVINDRLFTRRLPCLDVDTVDGHLELLTGRDPAELRWIAEKIREAIGC